MRELIRRKLPITFGAFIESYSEFLLGILPIQYPNPSSKQPHMIDMAPSRKNTIQVTVVAPAAPKGLGKTIDAPEPADRLHNLSNVYISDAEDSHSNSASSRGMQAAEPKPQLNDEQLLQMLFTMWKQIEDQQTKMIRHREAVRL